MVKNVTGVGSSKFKSALDKAGEAVYGKGRDLLGRTEHGRKAQSEKAAQTKKAVEQAKKNTKKK